MKLFLFKLKLAGYLGIFLLNLILIQIKITKIIFFTVFLIFFILSMFLFNSAKNLISYKNTKIISSYSPSQQNLYKKTEKTEFEIQNELIFWEDIVKKQPNSRDALINLSILKKLLNQNEEANSLWNKAKMIDPNNLVFKD